MYTVWIRGTKMGMRAHGINFVSPRSIDPRLWEQMEKRCSDSTNVHYDSYEQMEFEQKLLEDETLLQGEGVLERGF